MTGPLVAFPLRSEWEKAAGVVQQEEPYPAPLVTSEDGMDAVLPHPAPVDELAAYAEGLGWEVVRITYAEGWMPHSIHGTPGSRPKTSWAVRMRRGDQRAVAVYMGSAWKTMYVLSAAGTQKHTTLGDFKVAIR